MMKHISGGLTVHGKTSEHIRNITREIRAEVYLNSVQTFQRQVTQFEIEVTELCNVIEVSSITMNPWLRLFLFG
jgi:chorismate mutase